MKGRGIHMLKSDLNNTKLYFIEEFILDSFRGLQYYLYLFNLNVNKESLNKYSSIIIACIASFIKSTNKNNTYPTQNYLIHDFFYRMSNFDTENVSNNLSEIKNINEEDTLISFYIWCIDSFCYFYPEILYSPNFINCYPLMIESIVNDKENSFTLIEITNIFYTNILNAYMFK